MPWWHLQDTRAAPDRKLTSLTPASGPAVNGACPPLSRMLSRRQPAVRGATLMAELKFSCPQCGQHISATDQWSGHQIQCPACATTLTVPGDVLPPASTAPIPKSLVPQPPAAHGARLAAGATQVARASNPGPMPRQQLTARPPRSESNLLKYAIYAIVLAALGGAGYLYYPTLVSKIQDIGNSKPAQAAPATSSSGSGPLGEVNGAMDVSETLDGGASGSPPPRPAPARQPVAAQAPAAPTAPAARPAARGTNETLRARAKQSGRPVPAGGGH